MSEYSFSSSSHGTPHEGRRLRVCHLAYTFFETDNRVARYARALAERGHDVDVIALRRPGQPKTGEDRGVQVLRLQRRTKTEATPWIHLLKILWFMAASTVLLSRRHLARPYDVVHVHNVPDFLVFAALIPKLTRARIILDVHDVLPELYAAKFAASPGSAAFRALLLVERLSCRFADHVVVANHIWCERLARRARAVRKCSTILNYPDLRLFRPRTTDAHADHRRFVILYPGSLSRHQGVDVALKAFALVQHRMPEAEFHIYGEGPARQELVRYAHENGLEGRVRVMDPLPVDRIAAAIASANVGVEPKLASGFSNEALSTKILEFMASGVPVIVSKTLAHAHYFDDTVVRFFEPGNEQELAAALVAQYDARADKTLVDRAREFAAGFSWQKRRGDYYDIVESPTGTLPCREAVAL